MKDVDKLNIEQEYQSASGGASIACTPTKSKALVPPEQSHS